MNLFASGVTAVYGTVHPNYQRGKFPHTSQANLEFCVVIKNIDCNTFENTFSTVLVLGSSHVSLLFQLQQDRDGCQVACQLPTNSMLRTPFSILFHY